MDLEGAAGLVILCLEQFAEDTKSFWASFSGVTFKGALKELQELAAAGVAAARSAAPAFEALLRALEAEQKAQDEAAAAEEKRRAKVYAEVRAKEVRRTNDRCRLPRPVAIAMNPFVCLAGLASTA